MKNNIQLLLIPFIVISCRSNNSNGDSILKTNERLTSIEIVFTSPGVGSYTNEFEVVPYQIYLIKDMFSDLEIPKEILVDGWNNDFKCIIKSDYLYVWSLGKNKVDDEMKLDDIFMKIDIKNIPGLSIQPSHAHSSCQSN
jgi:hypothetical protein